MFSCLCCCFHSSPGFPPPPPPPNLRPTVPTSYPLDVRLSSPPHVFSPFLLPFPPSLTPSTRVFSWRCQMNGVRRRRRRRERRRAVPGILSDTSYSPSFLPSFFLSLLFLPSCLIYTLPSSHPLSLSLSLSCTSDSV